MTPDSFTQLTTLITIVGTGVGTVAIQIFRESRNRRWDLEDRERVAEGLKADVAALAIKTEQDHQRVADALALESMRAQNARAGIIATLAAQDAASDKTRAEFVTTTETTAAAIDAVHKAADNAYAEANHVNAKIENINARLAEARSIAVQTVGAVETVHIAAERAYVEANHVNSKIEDLNQRLLTAETDGPLPKIQRQVESTFHALLEGQEALAAAFEHERRNRKAGALAIQAAIARLATTAADLHALEPMIPADDPK